MHATYIGHHGDAAGWLADNPALTRELLNRCGYWLFPTSITLPSSIRRFAHHPVKVAIENRGVAPPYQPYELQLKLYGPGGSISYVIGTAQRSWRPGTVIIIEFDLGIPRDFHSGEYTVRLGLFDKTSPFVRTIDVTPEYNSAGMKMYKELRVGRPVELGLKESLRDNEGYYRVATVMVK
jgi:hypothetical protein